MIYCSLRRKFIQSLHSSGYIMWYLCHCPYNTKLAYRKEHTLDLLKGSQAAKEGNEGDDGTCGNEDVYSAQEQVSTQQLTHKRFIHQSPNTNPQHCDTSNL